MRQTTASQWAFGRHLAWVVAFLLLLPGLARGQDTTDQPSPAPAAGDSSGAVSFQDLPKDHWAFKDVNFLIKQGYMEGYPDGTFKGRKVTTRYDVALILARILRRMEGKKDAVDEATEAERAALGRLTKEFKDELGLLGVRVDTLERRQTEAEGKIKTLEDNFPKVKVGGFYRGRGQFVIEPSTITKNEAGDPVTYTDPGLRSFYQQIYLQFTGKPLDDKIEIYYELLGYVSGQTWNKLVYNDVGKNYGANPFDSIDDYVTKVQNDRYVQTNKLHFVSNARSMKVRVFAGESITGLDDPLNAMTEDTGIVDPFQGVELSGTDRDLTYQGAIYKSDWNISSSDLHEMLAGRLLWKLPSKFSPDALTVGTTYAEKINGYKIRGDSNTVRGADISYTTERAGKIQATAEFLTSTDYHKDTRDGKSRNLGDEGTKFDVSLQNGGFTGTVKHYDMGKDFRANMAPVWAYDVGDDNGNWYPYEDPVYEDNYKHVGFWGEKLTRFSANYDFGNKLLSIAKNLSMEATWLSKTWEVDQFAAQPTDGYSGRKFTYQILSDFTDSTTLKWDFAQKLDALPDENGTIENTLELNLKLNDSVSTKGKIFVLTDHDDIDTVDGETYKYNERVGYFEVNSNINPRVYAKGSVEHQVRWVSAPKENLRIDYIGEATYNFTPTTSLTGGVQHIDYEDRGTPAKSSLANAILAELKKNFTHKFRGRALYTRGVIDFKDGLSDTIDRENIYGELIYDISKDARIRFKFGYDYPDEWRWDISSYDNGRDKKSIYTQKVVTFEARANF
ncbi:MAG: S-layer homology domain-containing protein [Candidatus Riflebacteria bacterium]|nr:S-layer homology domain-containing protein [Candidatus Riflebacteria bacterium]